MALQKFSQAYNTRYSSNSSSSKYWTRYGLNHNAVAQAYGLPTKTERGTVNTDYYYREEYDKIFKYTDDEFIYPELYKKMKHKMVTAEKLQESVSFWMRKI